MKRLLSALLASALLLSAVLPSAVTAEGKTKFEETYFPDGVEPPATGYVYLAGDDKLCLRYEISPQLTAYWDDKDPYQHSSMAWASYYDPERIGPFFEAMEMQINSTWYYYQFDVKCNDGDWHYTPEWDTLREDGYPNGYWLDLFRDYMWWHWSPDEKNERKVPLFDSIVTNAPNGQLYDPDLQGMRTLEKKVYDLEENTLTFRARYMVIYREDEAHGGEQRIVLSDWSEEWSVGKDGDQEIPPCPEKIEPPVLSALREPDEDGYVPFWVTVGEGTLEALRYYDVNTHYAGFGETYDPLLFELQYSLDDGATWQEPQEGTEVRPFSDEIYTQTIDLRLEGLKPTSSLQLRMRVVDNWVSDGALTTDWSNVLCFNSTPAPETEALLEDTEAEPATELSAETQPAPAEPETEAAAVEAEKPALPLGLIALAAVAALGIVGAALVVMIRRERKS